MRSIKKIAGMVVVGLAIGYGISLWLDPERRQRHKDFLKERLDTLKHLSEIEVYERLTGVFAENSEMARQAYRDAEVFLMKKLDKAKKAVGLVNREKYIEVISEVIEDLAKDKTISAKGLAKLRTYWESDYAVVREYLK